MKRIILIQIITALTAFADFKFQPKFSEFSVTYPVKPEAKVMAFTGNDGIDAEAIHTEAQKGHAVMKAEFLPILDHKILNAQSDEQIRAQMLEYARHNGLAVSHAVVERDRGTRIAILRATKLIGKDKTPATILNKTYYGKKSMLLVYVAAPSKFYPTEETSNFLKSVSW